MPNTPPAADDHQSDLRQLLTQGADYAAALDEIAHDDPRRLADIVRQIRVWRRLLGTALDNFGAPPHDEPIMSPYEWAARQFDPKPGQPEDTSTQ